MLARNQQITLSIFGFPSQYEDNYKSHDKFGNQMKLHQYGLARSNKIVGISLKDHRVSYGISTLGGQSGCPVVVDRKIIAIHIGGGNAN